MNFGNNQGYPNQGYPNQGNPQGNQPGYPNQGYPQGYQGTPEENAMAAAAFGQVVGSTMAATMQGKNPVGVLSHGMATMLGMDPQASQMMSGFGQMSDNMLPPEHRSGMFPNQGPSFPPSNQGPSFPNQGPSFPPSNQGPSFPPPSQGFPPAMNPGMGSFETHYHSSHSSSSSSSSPFPSAPPSSFPSSSPSLPSSSPSLSGPAMSSSDFDRLKMNIGKESFGDSKLSVLDSAAKHAFFTTEQVKSLMKLFSFSDEQIKCAKICYPRCVDRQSFYEVMGVLTFDSDKKKLKSELNL